MYRYKMNTPSCKKPDSELIETKEQEITAKNRVN